jgi:4'-phosphopantetheinyl transferase
MQRDLSNWLPSLDHLDLQPHQVDVWRISLDLPPASVKSLESNLSADEAQRAERFHFPTGREHYIVAHGVLRDLLARYLHCEPSQLDFSTTDYGKPILNSHKLEFNLSHSGDFALLAITQEYKVGVDVERIRPELEHESIARRFFSPNEVSELMALPSEQREIAFFNAWTRKEAYIKAQGLGLSLPLDSFDVSLTPNKPAILRAIRPDARAAFDWTLLSLDVEPNYTAAAAVEGQSLEIRLLDWDTRTMVRRT